MLKYLVPCLCLLVAACKKDGKPPLPPDKDIKSFVFKAGDNTASHLPWDVSGLIKPDSILFSLSDSIDITGLVPSINFSGKSINPANKTAQDFSAPVKYVVTAENGSTKTYTVKIILLSAKKEITSFSFLKANNPNLAENVTGIISNDTITVSMPGNIPKNQLVPSIKYTGTDISPHDNMATDFSAPVQYTVKAGDGTTKTYIVYVRARQDVYFGATDGYVYKLDGVTGDVKWKFKTGGYGVTGPVIGNGIVYAGSTDKYIYAIDANTGNLVWKLRAAGGICTYPAIEGSKLYVQCTGTYNDRNPLMAIDAKTGNIDWIQSDYAILGNPTVNGNLIYEGDLGSITLTFNTNGIFEWGVDNGITYQNTAVADGMIFNGGEGSNCFAADALTGEIKWSKWLVQAGPTGSPTVSHGLVFVGESNKVLYAFDEFTGEVIWSLPSGGTFSSPVVEDEFLYVNNSNGHLSALDPLTGAGKWSYFVPGNIDCTIANGILYAGGDEGYLYALDGHNGNLLWKFKTNGKITSAAGVQDSGGATFYCGASGEHN